MDREKRNPLALAKQLENEPMVQLLQENGAVSAKESKAGKNDPNKKKKEKKKEEEIDPLSIEKKIKKMEPGFVRFKLVNKRKVRESTGSQIESTQQFMSNYPYTMKFLQNYQYLLETDFISDQIKKGDWRQVAHKILSNLWKVKGSSIFHQPVDPIELNIKDYFSVVKNPMDFSLIKQKLQQNLYENFHKFKEDLDLVFHNCQLYNGTDSHVGQIGVSVRV